MTAILMPRSVLCDCGEGASVVRIRSSEESKETDPAQSKPSAPLLLFLVELPLPHSFLPASSQLPRKLAWSLAHTFLRLGRIKVKSTEAEILEKSQIEAIASSLASQNEVPAAPLEELAYRRSLRVALDVLSDGPVWSQESPAGTGRANRSLRGKPMEHVSSPCDSNSSPLPRGDVLGSSRPHRRRPCVQQSPSSSFTCEKDPECIVDHKKGLRRSENPRGPSVLPAGGGAQDESGSRIHHRNWTPASKKGGNSAQKASLCPSGSSLSEDDAERDVGSKGGSWAAPSLPSGVREDDPCANAEGRDPGLPLGSLTVLPAPEPLACSEPGECPAKKRLRLDGSQRPPAGQLEPRAAGAAPSPGPGSGPRECMTLRSTARLGPPPSHTSVGETRCPPCPDSQKLEKDCQSSEESMGSNSMRSILEEDEEDEEPPRVLLYHEPRSFEVGMLVWLKYKKYPSWPAVVKSVRQRDKKASVLYIEGHMNPKMKGFTVSLKSLKHFDCKEKQTLLSQAREDFDQAIGWCVSLITDYRVRLGCGSFAGSFLEYYAADISYPVRKSIQQDVLGTKFPQLSKGSPEEPVVGWPLGQRQPCRKVLPDRSRAARDRANQKLVEYIVKAKGAESHLRAILKSRKPSRWLQSFLNSSQYVTCVETYLEDEGQLDLVVKYLQGVYQEVGAKVLRRTNGDRIRFILDVLLPEAIICAISAVDEVDYKTAEEKYIKGPSLSYREKEIFDNQLLEERNRRRR
ncbi:PWWP domain-containing DNA repair factor 3A isoform X1 [Nomascus leucogenys]|uniref:PWWP domain-containing DNA repair factor 3A isoform X1 n=2 Tax=Nomascus leucogenys TaxID=61853 RepID=UPI00122D886D|nr:PWWP domain-containing DNA repair factor 3A isoform X1 [Nomascus leucogenys]XP_030652249.1 PWWP domain-containing DNA repair factor 3A isoform X1 [Nomascus leucogenys]